MIIVDNTKILENLLDFLPSCFNVDPQKDLAFQITSDGSFTWEIMDDSFLIWTVSTTKPAHTLSLSNKTIAKLVEQINALPNFGASLLAGGRSSAFRLIGEKTGNGDAVHMFSSNLWAIFQAYALELAELWASSRETLRQLNIPGSTGLLENYWGSFFGVGRHSNEPDPQYGARIISSVEQLLTNNVAIARLLNSVFGFKCHVIDLGDDSNRSMFDPDPDPDPGEPLLYPAFTMMMNDPENPIHGAYNLWRPWRDPDQIYDSSFLPPDPSVFFEPCTFGIVLEDVVVPDLSKDELASLRSVVLAIKASGTRPKLIWRRDAKVRTMQMNNPATPINDVAWPIRDINTHQHYYGWSAMYLTNVT